MYLFWTCVLISSYFQQYSSPMYQLSDLMKGTAFMKGQLNICCK